MQRLTGLDAAFLYMETPSSYMHVAGLAIFDPSTANEEFSIDKIKEVYAQRLHLAPPFRRRLVEVPLGIHHPLWIEDPNFELDWHIRHIAVPPPGGPKQLADLASHLVSLQLDRSKPLWELWVIEGLEGGKIAALTKTHHAAIDGVSGNEMTVAVLDLTPEVAEVPPPDPPWQPDRIPTDPELLAYAMQSLSRQPLLAAKAVRRTAQAAISLRRKNREPDTTPPPAPFSAPRTSFNVALTPHRSFAYTSLSLSTVKDVKNALGVTVNDVVLASCAGALRKWLDAHDEHPDGPLIAMVPVSVRGEEEGAGGNRVSSMLTSLATDIDDPLERIREINKGTIQAKDQLNAIGAETLQDWAEFAAPAVAGLAARLYSRTRMADRHRPLFNVTISNVPGPPFPLYSAGGQLLAHYPMGPIFDGGGLNMTVMSYLDQLDFGLVACPDVLPDVELLAEGLHESLQELVDGAGLAKPSANGQKRKSPRSKANA
jgi:WS/DGAT/MGAT family acyltransferase